MLLTRCYKVKEIFIMSLFEKQKPLKEVRNVLLVGSGKGGVGKSTISLTLAFSLKEKGYKTALLDGDIYGPSLPHMLKTQKKPLIQGDKIHPLTFHGLKLMSLGLLISEEQAVIWRGPMLFKVLEQFLRDVLWGKLDYLIVDLPPGTGDVALTIAQKVPVQGALVVTTPQNISLIDAKKALDMFDKLEIPVLGVIENMAYFKTHHETLQLFPKGYLDEFLKEKKLPKLATIPFSQDVGLCAEEGLNLLDNSSDQDLLSAFQNLAQQVEKTCF